MAQLVPSAPVQVKVTMFFSDGKYGWSESYYINSPAPSSKVGGSLILATLPAAVRLAKLRNQMLPSTPSSCPNFGGPGNVSVPQLDFMRLSQVGTPRNTAVYSPQSGVIVGATANNVTTANNVLSKSPLLSDMPADNPYSGVEMLLTLGNGLTSRRVLSGVPDIAICDQGWSNTNPWYSLWIKFADELVSGGWGVISSSIVANNFSTDNATPILAITQDGMYGRPTLSVPVPIAFSTLPNGCPNYRVRVLCYKSQAPQFPNLNGSYRVVVPNGGSSQGSSAQVQLTRSFKPLQPLHMGFIMAEPTPALTPIVLATLTRTVSKKRGRPFGLPRGRARVIR